MFLENEEKPTRPLETEVKENGGQGKQNNLKKLIYSKQTDKPQKEVLISHFADMNYLLLIRENPGIFSDGCMPWYEYALLGSLYDTYEKGINCYNEVNLLYEKWQVDRDFDELKDQFGEGCMNSYYRRHIVAFSPNAERILLKTYINPPFSDRALYEIYDRNIYMHSYIYREIIDPNRVNFTKGIQFATLNDEPGFNYGNTYIFYKISSLSNYYDMQEAKQYDISAITDSNDTLFYKADVNSQGEKCIGLYSISDNELIFQSESIENYPDTVDILNNKLIAGFGYEGVYCYIEINIETNEATYLFKDQKGSFSPDGKYFAYPTTTKDNRGYNIYSVETGEMAFIKSYGLEPYRANCPYDNNICCWVRKEKVEELKGFIKQ